MDTLRGVIERLTFHSEETGYTVARLLPERGSGGQGGGWGRGGEITIVGNMAGVNVGESVELTGRWTVHAEHGRQFAVETMRTLTPATVAGMEKYLGSGLIKGVGPVTAKRIVKQFGVDTLDVIDHTPERLHEVPGVGKKRVALIQRAWAEQRAIKEVMIFLQSHGVSTSLATKIYKFYGDEAISVVQQDPYRLAHDIYGIGFLTADKIARALGIPDNAPQRVAAGVAFALSQATEEGHIYLPTSDLVESAAKLLDLPPRAIATGVLRLWEEDRVKVVTGPGAAEIDLGHASGEAPPGGVQGERQNEIPRILAEQGQLYATATLDRAEALLREEPAVYLTGLYYSEMGTANRLLRLASEGQSPLATHFRTAKWPQLLAQLERETGVTLAAQQQAGVRAALTCRLTVLTGGPGTGKTTSVRSILHLARAARATVLLAAPTGRAAKRLSETTGQEARTIHRLLEFQPSGGMSFKRNEENPLDGQLLIVDEASMLDLVLAHHLLKAIPPGMNLLLVGDVDQLPSVGAGNVLKDVIAAIRGDLRSQMYDLREDVSDESSFVNRTSKIVNSEVVELDVIFRQAADSHIITNAHRINSGDLPIIDNKRSKDFFLFKTKEPERAAQLCVELVQTRIPRRFGIASDNIQLLCPMHRGVVGVGALNEALQRALNPAAPDKPQRAVGSRIYRPGDRVMQMRNNYDKDVYNGDLGQVVAIDTVEQSATVLFDGRPVAYDFLELDELTHAWAISVHKAQGSEFPAVVIPLLTTHYMMLQRNLLYTAVTRAKRLVVLVGQQRALAIAVNNNRVVQRYTGLAERLVNEHMYDL